MFFRFFGCLLLTAVFFLAPAALAAEVRVTLMLSTPLSEQHKVFTTTPRLTEVLADVGALSPWYWPASTLYQLNTPATTLLKQRAHAELTLLLSSASPAEVPTLTALRAGLGRWTLAQRKTVSIDYDLARLKASANPGFAKGDYLMQLTTRPTNITVFGAVPEQQLPLLAATDVRAYLQHISLPAYAETGWFTLLQADGRMLRVNTLTAASEPIEAMPGSIIIVPFKTAFLSSRYNALNGLLLELALHRVW